MFRNRFFELRIERGLTQEQLASILGCTVQDYVKYEIGTAEIPIQMAICLAKLYNVPSDYMAGLTNERRCHKRKK